jgi:hypothetical protein
MSNRTRRKTQRQEEVYFEIILPKSSYLNYRLGITKSVLKGETSIEAWDRACTEAEVWHKKKHPELYKFNEVSLTVEETSEITEMELCETVQQLATHKSHLTNNTQPYYVAQLKKLSNNFTNND